MARNDSPSPLRSELSPPAWLRKEEEEGPTVADPKGFNGRPLPREGEDDKWVLPSGVVFEEVSSFLPVPKI